MNESDRSVRVVISAKSKIILRALKSHWSGRDGPTKQGINGAARFVARYLVH